MATETDRNREYKMGNPELHVNSVTKKQAHDKAPTKTIKKLRKAEVNYLPPHPQGERKGSLEHEKWSSLMK